MLEKIEVGEIFTISDESDVEQQVEVLAVMDIEGTDYVAVSFLDDLQEETDDDIDIFFLKVDEEGDLDAIQTDEEFDKVAEAFEELMEQEEIED
ncbi:polyribonucleotide nucleotidyltransferase [Bacillus sp. B-jedd]|nr:polyribonucleotide nucleotidyltransferase [Bacillus sp. B-jedd]